MEKNKDFQTTENETLNDYMLLFEKSETASIIIDREGIYLDHNKAYRMMMGYSEKTDLSKFHPWDVSPEFQPDGENSYYKGVKIIQIAYEIGKYEFEWLHQFIDGEQFTSKVILEKIRFKQKDCLLVSIYDISEKKKIERIVNEKTKELKEKNFQLETIFCNSMIGMIVTNENRIIIKCNQRVADSLGYDSPEELIGLSTSKLHSSKEQFDEFEKEYSESILSGYVFQREYPFKKKDGSIIWCLISGSVLDDCIPPDISKGSLWVAEDITEKKKMEQELKEQYDLAKDSNPLTGLPGNNTITNNIKKIVIEQANKCILYADLDNFKSYNDKYGFLRGDEVLIYTAELLKSVSSKLNIDDYFIGHIGGDDFVLIFSEDKVDDVSQFIIREFDEGIKKFYCKEDLKAMKIITCDRQGSMCEFPIMSISLAGVMIKDMPTANYIEVIDICADTKKIAKKSQESNFVMNKRKY